MPDVLRLLGAARQDCVARVSGRPQFGHLASLLWEADVLRTPEVEHPTQNIDGGLDLGRSTLIGARSTTITDDPLKAADVGLYQRSPGVASGYVSTRDRVAWLDGPLGARVLLHGLTSGATAVMCPAFDAAR